MNDIDQRLRGLGAKIPTPDVPLEDDLARGRRRLGLHRLLVTGGTVAASHRDRVGRRAGR